MYNHFSLKILAKKGLGDIVGSGSETSGDQYDFRKTGFLVQRLPNGFPIIADCHPSGNTDALTVQFLRHPCAVGVYYLADEQLVANGDDAGLGEMHNTRFLDDEWSALKLH
jgi:hypothetical protein